MIGRCSTDEANRFLAANCNAKAAISRRCSDGVGVSALNSDIEPGEGCGDRMAMMMCDAWQDRGRHDLPPNMLYEGSTTTAHGLRHTTHCQLDESSAQSF
jgi:hypothetical protein